jgi:hypothetical protein
MTAWLPTISGGRRHQRNVAEILANLGNFLQHGVELVQRVLLLELAFQIGEHATWHLRHQNAAVHRRAGCLRTLRTSADLAEIRGDLLSN